MWIVMTSAARMPRSCRGSYRNVALVKITPQYAAEGRRPKIISKRARGVETVEHLGHHNVGKTERCAYCVALAEAQERADRLNA